MYCTYIGAHITCFRKHVISPEIKARFCASSQCLYFSLSCIWHLFKANRKGFCVTVSETKISAKRRYEVKILETMMSQEIFFFFLLQDWERKLNFPLNSHSQILPITLLFFLENINQYHFFTLYWVQILGNTSWH